MNLNRAMAISSSGLHAERFRMDVISSNIANANSISANGTPAYRRQITSLQSGPNGVRVQAIRTDQTPLRQVYDPGHPAANANGYVEYSNVEPVKEMVDMLSATRAYEANITAFNAARNMARSALSIGQR